MKNLYFTLLLSSIFFSSFGQSSELVFLKLNINSGSSFYNTEIYFNDNATLGFNFGYDAQFFGEVPAFSIYTLLVEENVGDPYVIQAVNSSDLADVTFPLGVNAGQGQPTTIEIASSTLPATSEVYLEDTLANTSTLLTSSDFTITPSTALSGTGRFFLRITDPTLTSIFTYDGSWSPNDPSGITTLSNDLVVLSGDAILTTGTTVNTISVEPGASLTINTGELSATTIELKSSSTSYASLMHTTSSNIAASEITYERYVNSNAAGNDLVSAPLSGQTWSNFLNDNTSALLNDGNTNPTTYAFAPFDKTTGDFENLNSNSSFQLSNGIGYRAATNLGELLTFSGVYPIHNNQSEDAITVNITNEGPDYAEWNLVGNPYPAYLDVAEFFNHEIGDGLSNINLFTAVRAGIYAYNGNNYDVINLANVAAKPLMAPGQGFFVSANQIYVEDYNLEFSVLMQSPGNSDDYITGRTSTLKFLTLGMTTENDQSKTEFYFNEIASLGMDIGYDAALWDNTVSNFEIYSHLVQDNSGVPIELQTLNSADFENISIPLGVHANQGEQLRFSILESTLSESISIYLEDTVNNTITLLNEGDYIITPTVDLSGTGRFFLRTSEDALSINESTFNSINVYAITNSKELIVAGQLLDVSTVVLYDSLGRQVFSGVLDLNTLENRIDLSTLNTGLYVVKIENSMQHISQKIIMK